jgi:microsomal epoxide hydrolase
VPVALLDAPHELFRTPLPYATARFTDIVQYTEASSGGHFFAMEQPAALAADVQQFIAKVQARKAAAVAGGEEL